MQPPKNNRDRIREERLKFREQMNEQDNTHEWIIFGYLAIIGLLGFFAS